jgi:hypothetical protein
MTSTIHPTDTLRVGDRAVLTRTVPAGVSGPNSPAWTMRHVVTIALLVRLDDLSGTYSDLPGPQWCLDTVERDERAGCWAIGRERNGTVTTLEPLPVCEGCGANADEECFPFCLSADEA